MSVFLFILLSLLLTAALILTVYGFSTPLTQAGLVLLYILVDGVYIGWKVFFIVLAAAVIAEVMEFFAGVKGAKKARGSTRSAWGAIIGGIVGAIFLSPILFPLGSIAGSFLGTFAGALAMELTATESKAKAIRVGYGAMMGRIMGFCIKTAISIGIVFGVAVSGLIKMIF